MDILQKITAQKQKRLVEARQRKSLGELYRSLEKDTPQRRLSPLSADSFQVIAEVKRASPSLGSIPWTLSLTELVQSYEQGGAGVISVLTEEDFFGGSIRDLEQVRFESNLPVLRKDFLWTEYQLVESRLHGADIILLIVALLDRKTLTELLVLAYELELEVLVECHTREEVVQALDCGARVLGINNRNLKNFQVKLETTVELCAGISKGHVLVSESGIRTPQDASLVAACGVNAVLVGESCLRQINPGQQVADLLAQGQAANRAFSRR